MFKCAESNNESIIQELTHEEYEKDQEKLRRLW